MAAKGGPGGKPGCGSLPDATKNFPVRALVVTIPVEEPVWIFARTPVWGTLLEQLLPGYPPGSRTAGGAVCGTAVAGFGDSSAGSAAAAAQGRRHQSTEHTGRSATAGPSLSCPQQHRRPDPTK